jgi:hypothetical protein
MPLTPDWAKSSHSDPNGGNCVEARQASTSTVQVRDSKAPSSRVLSFSSDSWRMFTAAIQAAGPDDLPPMRAAYRPRARIRDSAPQVEWLRMHGHLPTQCYHLGGAAALIAGGHTVLSQRVLSRSLAVKRVRRYRERVSCIPVAAGKRGNVPSDTASGRTDDGFRR